MAHIRQKTAQQIVETVQDVCGQDVNFIDKDGKIFASTRASRIGTFHQVGKQVLLTGETIEVSEEDNYYGTMPGINMPIAYKGELVAAIGISGSPDEVRRYAYLAQKITLLLLKEHDSDSLQASKKNELNYILRALLDEEQAGASRVKAYLAEHGISTDTAYVTVRIRLDGRYNPVNLSLIEQKIYAVFSRTREKLYTFHYPSEYLLLLPQEKWEERRESFERLAADLGDVIRVGIGGGHGIFEQHRSYEEAGLALKSMEGALCEYERLGLALLLSGVEKKTAELFCEKFLGDLNTEECSLLRLYYEKELSLKDTAESLFVHKNTVQYQLEKILKKTGRNPRVFKEAAGFYAALLLEGGADGKDPLFSKAESDD